jgi:hypothetical protein
LFDGVVLTATHGRFCGCNFNEPTCLHRAVLGRL